ncbi:2207_t:CDS:2 [Cetraspora pellucida]|uniref:2207_t:CDS:1 n=1 Tax=Cetraspora pellucida TaxID=1433469 RepID=A0A9N9J374_9GLOM|nr:2207_t:CDS:2 [Cetraspora pellucida]
MANYDDDSGELSGQFSFNKQYEMSDNITISSSSNASIFDKNQLNKKKNKTNKLRRTYAKSSWVWNYFETSNDGKYNECQTPNFEHEESSDDDNSSKDEDLKFLTLTNYYRHQTHSVINTANQSNDHTHITQTIFKTLQHTIYDSLFDYWSEPLMPRLLASLLDPRLKILAIWSENV